MSVTTERCPWCEGVVSRAKFLEVEARIREQEQQRLAATELQVKKQLEYEFAGKLTLEREALEKTTREEIARQVAAITVERDHAAAQVKQSVEHEATLRKQLQEEATQHAASIAAERDQARQQLAQAHNREASIRQEMHDAATKQLEPLLRDKEQLTSMLKEAEARETTIRVQAHQDAEQATNLRLQEAERVRQQELQHQRQLLTKERDDALLKAQADFNREREGYQKKTKDLERQLLRKTAQDIGDGAEIDLYEALKTAFPGDQITRIQKGAPGADMLHDVLYKGESCGRIIIDSKNRQAWQNTFITKLRQDQTDEGAEHAVLSSTVFPSGKKELCIESDVIVVNPARACHVIGLLRRTMITLHVRGLSIKERAGKMSKLYKLITSESYTQRFGELNKLTNDILDIDVQEKKAHDNVWRKRGALETRLGHALRDIETEVGAIIEGRNDTELSAAS